MDKQQLSAFLDGEWTDDTGTPWRDPDGAAGVAEDWQCWHVIGDAMRQIRCLDVNVADRVRMQLAETETPATTSVLGRRVRRSQRYAGWAVAASLALAGVVGWNQLAAPAPEVSLQTMAAPSPVGRAVMPVARPVASDGDDNPYITAHHELAFESVSLTVALQTQRKP